MKRGERLESSLSPLAFQAVAIGRRLPIATDLRAMSQYVVMDVLWIREIAEGDIKSVGETAPTIDSIEIAEFESHADLKEWLSTTAPAFVQ